MDILTEDFRISYLSAHWSYRFLRSLSARLVGVLGFAIGLPVLYFGIVFRKIERSF